MTGTISPLESALAGRYRIDRELGGGGHFAMTHSVLRT
jgi:hypothetical protein